VGLLARRAVWYKGYDPRLRNGNKTPGGPPPERNTAFLVGSFSKVFNFGLRMRNFCAGVAGKFRGLPLAGVSARMRPAGGKDL